MQTSVVVIGAGVIGAAVADRLAARGARVTVLEMRSPGRGASFASAGVLAPYIEAHGDTPLLQLATRSLALFDRFIADVAERGGRPIEYACTGTLDVALTADEASKLIGAKAWLDGKGVACEWLDARACREFEPSVTGTAQGGLYVPEHGLVGVTGLVGALVHAARMSGATFEAPVEAAAVDPQPDHVEVRAGDRRYRADFVVIAGGSWSSRVRIAGARPLPVRPIRGQLLHLRWTQPDRPSRVVWGSRCYTVPWTDGSVLVGATVEDVGFDETSTVAGVRDLTDAVGELLPASWQASLEAVRVGLRPAAPDGLPVIGPLAEAPHVIAATGHYRNGVLLSPLTAEIVAAAVLDGVTDPAIAITTPNRFQGSAGRDAVLQ